jgi:hypothetical protein
MFRKHRKFLLIVPVLVASAALLGLVASATAEGGAGSGAAVPLAIPVGGKIQADNACYVRLPDLPGARYGGLAAYNPETGVLAYAGGAERRTARVAIAYDDMWAIKLDGSAGSWSTIQYALGAGYMHGVNRGCREPGTLPLSATNWASIGGRSGCDGTSAGMGDLKELHVGAKADASEVRWVPNTGANLAALPPILRANNFVLSNPFVAYDTPRQRIVFGEGTFNRERDALTRNEVYYATVTGYTWSIRQLFPAGTPPAPRYGSCAAYVNDPAQGLDGIIVLGGIQGAPTGVPATAYKEVWWLDFKAGDQGRWVDISARFGNLADLGARRDGACAYDPGTKLFYSWMGRADTTIPDGASHSAGMWRVSLGQLGDPAAVLTWERLAKDNLADINGRRYLGNVYDLRNKRFFAVGGYQGADEYADVWAIYPDVTGDACTNLDPYAPFRNPATPTVAPAPTATPVPAQPEVCDAARTGVPAAALSAALANPSTVSGYNELCNPNAGSSTFNHKRDRLSLERSDRPYHPLFNSLVWKCGCP